MKSKNYMKTINIGKKLFLLSLLMVLIIPVAVSAQPQPTNTPYTLTEIAAGIVENIVKPILWSVSIAFVIIMVTLAGFKYLTAQGDPGKVNEAHKAVIWGTVGVSVIVLAWSIIYMIETQFGV